MYLLYLLGFRCSSVCKESDCNAGDLGSILGQEDPLEKEMASHPSILSWSILWREESGRLQSMGSQESYMTEWLNTQQHVFITILSLVFPLALYFFLYLSFSFFFLCLGDFLLLLGLHSLLFGFYESIVCFWFVVKGSILNLSYIYLL